MKNVKKLVYPFAIHFLYGDGGQQPSYLLLSYSYLLLSVEIIGIILYFKSFNKQIKNLVYCQDNGFLIQNLFYNNYNSLLDIKILTKIL